MSNAKEANDRLNFHGVELGWLDPRTLTLNPFNYRTHGDEQRSAIASSIAEHGWVAFPIFNERTGRLIDGHARKEQAVRDGEEGIVCVIVNKDEGSEKRLLASLHRTADLAGQDAERLAQLVQDAFDEGPAMPAGWTQDALADLILGQVASDEAAVAAALGPEATPAPVTSPTERTRNVNLKLTEQEFLQYTISVEQLKAEHGLEADKWAVLFALERATES